MAYFKAKMKSSGEKASCFRPFSIGKLSDDCLWTLLYVSFKLILIMPDLPMSQKIAVYILISLTNFTGTPNSMRILCNTSPFTES
jgi:hypothetical protein